jgi:hypothetical protein
LVSQSSFKKVPVLVRGGFYGKGKTGDENRIRLRDAAAKALETASCRMVPVYADPALNERCYGDLQVNKCIYSACQFRFGGRFLIPNTNKVGQACLSEECCVENQVKDSVTCSSDRV